MGMGFAGGGLDFFPGGRGFAIGDIAEHGVIEQDGFLSDQSDPPPQAGQGEFP